MKKSSRITHFQYVLKHMGNLFVKNKKTSEEEISNYISNVEGMNIPFNVKNELVSKLYKDLEN